jgi:GNAT superfamily N-acetyltransferase
MPHISLSAQAEPEAERVIGPALNAFNDVATGYTDRQPLNVIVRETPDGPIIGGILGRTSLGLLFVELVYLPQQLRGTGLGAQMMAMVEAEARRRGCKGGVLFTITFQAPGFYQRLGWEVFGTIPCDPPGTARVFLRKDFTSPP